jgi:Tfp pilus assembly protein PilZ
MNFSEMHSKNFGSHIVNIGDKILGLRCCEFKPLYSCYMKFLIPSILNVKISASTFELWDFLF